MNLRTIVFVLSAVIVGVGAQAAFGALVGSNGSPGTDQLAAAALNAKPLTVAETAARQQSKDADAALYACLKKNGASVDAWGGLSPSEATKALCAGEAGTATALHADATVKAAYRAEGVLVDAAWYCTQQKGYDVFAMDHADEHIESVPSGLWDTFEACKTQVGAPSR